MRIGVLKHRHFFYILPLFFFTRIINITLLPIFNDEGIYLDWGWREITHGNLYYSLYDAKQPFLMWLFGSAELLINDPLLAGRIVSSFFGLFTIIGIYCLGIKFFSKRIALFSVLFYTFIPIFTFYDRQALMESAIGAVGVWSCYLFSLVLEKNENKYAILLGIALGIGYFIKSSALLFLFTFLFLSGWSVFRDRNITMIKSMGVTTLVVVATDLLLFINPEFWQTLSSNSRFSLTISELLGFPLMPWLWNAVSNLMILFYYITPLVCIGVVIGMVLIAKKNFYFFLWVIIPLIVQTLIIRFPSQRYLVSFLPLLGIFAAVFVDNIYKRNPYYGFLLLCIALLIPGFLTIIQIVNPSEYILGMAKFTKTSEVGYVQGQTAGYGIPETITYLETQANRGIIFVGVTMDSGNPQNAILSYFHNDSHIRTAVLDDRLFGNTLDTLDCLQVEYPVYFVSRGDEIGKLKKYFSKMATIKNPYSSNTIGIYRLKQHCKGKTASFSLQGA